MTKEFYDPYVTSYRQLYIKEMDTQIPWQIYVSILSYVYIFWFIIYNLFKLLILGTCKILYIFKLYRLFVDNLPVVNN